MIVRTAQDSDADAICEVLRRSIIELCEADHKGDPNALAQWLANKTPENIGQWIANPANVLLVIESASEVIAAGAITTGGEIMLNYVSPATRFQGASKMMMQALEDELGKLGIVDVTLDSTETAHRFYKRLGYQDAGPAGQKHSLPNYPMAKNLSK